MAGQMGSAPTDEASMAAALDAWLQQSPDEELLLAVYDEYIGGASYEDNLTSFGKVSYGAPSSISIYTDSFEDKEAVSDCIAAYNAGRMRRTRSPTPTMWPCSPAPSPPLWI